MSLGKLVKRLNLLFRVVVVKSTSLRSRRLKGKVGGGGGGPPPENGPHKCAPVLQWYVNPHSQNPSDMGILFSHYLSDLGSG